MPRPEKQYLKHKQQEKSDKRQRWNDFKRIRCRKKRGRKIALFLRRICLRRSRKKRMAFLLFLSAAILYLAIVGAYREVFFSVNELEETGIILEYDGGNYSGKESVFRISIRLINGEIVFFHEKTETEDSAGASIHNVRP